MSNPPCTECDGTGVLFIIEYAYAHHTRPDLDWRQEPYAAPCHACADGAARAEAGL